MSNLLISVVMPVYNEQRYLASALDSILNQTYKNIELVVVDDGSVDGTKEILCRYEKSDKRVKAYFQENAGIASALNKGVKLSTGDYIARMDADDLSRPERLKIQIDFLLKNKLHVVGGGVNRFDENQNKLKNYPLGNAEIKSSILVWEDSFAHPAVLISKSLLQKYKYIDFFNGVEDMHLWMCLALDPSVRMGNVPNIVLDYRRHSKQVTKQKNKCWFVEKKVLAMHQVLNEAGVEFSKEEVEGLYLLLQKHGVLTLKTADFVVEYMKKIGDLNCFDLETKKQLKKKLLKKVYKKAVPFGFIGLGRIMFASTI